MDVLDLAGWHVVRLGVPLPPPAGEVWAEVVQRADGLTLVDAPPPEIFITAGNYRGPFAHLTEKRLDHLGVRIVAPDASGNEPPAGLPDDVRKKIEAVLSAGAASVIPMFGLLRAAGSLAATLYSRWRAASVARLNAAEILLDTIDVATRDAATVLLFEDVTAPDRVLIWKTVLYHVTRISDRGLLIVVGADGPPHLESGEGPDPITGHPAILAQMREAVREGRASWRWIAPLDIPRVEQWLGPIDYDLAQRLIAVAGGDDTVARRLWSSWASAGYVGRDERGRWARTGVDEPFEKDVFSVLTRRLQDKELLPTVDTWTLTRRALDFASLSGETFSAAAVCDVLAARYPPVTPDALCDALDDLTPSDGQPWLLDTVESVELPSSHGPTWHWLYRFASTDLARFFAARWAMSIDGEEAREMIAHELLKSVRRLHADHPLFDACGYELSRTAGARDLAQWYATRQANTARRAQLVAQAFVLMSLPDDDQLAIADLIDLGYNVLDAGNVRLATDLGERAAGMADRVGSTSDRAAAHRFYGLAVRVAGFGSRAIEQLTKAVDLQLEVLAEAPSNATYQRSAAISLKELGVAHSHSGQARPAIERLTEAVELQRRVLEDDPDNPTYQRDLGMILAELGIATRSAGEATPAIEQLTEAAQLFRAALAGDADNHTYQRDLAITLSALGSTYHSADQQRAIEFLIEAVKLHRTVLASDPDNRIYQDELATSLAEVGVAYLDTSQAQPAVDHLTEAVKLQRNVVAHFPHPGSQRALAVSLKLLANVHSHTRQGEAAIEHLTEAVKLERAVLADDSRNLRYQRDLAIMLAELGVAYRNAGQVEPAIAQLTEASEFHRVVLASDPDNPIYQRDLAVSVGALGTVYHMAGRREAAIAPLSEAMKLYGTVLARDPDNSIYQRDLASTLSVLANAYYTTDQREAAIAPLSEAVELHRALLASDPDNAIYQRELALNLAGLGIAALKMGRQDAAIGHLTEAAKLHRALLARDPNNRVLQQSLAGILAVLEEWKS